MPITESIINRSDRTSAPGGSSWAAEQLQYKLATFCTPSERELPTKRQAKTTTFITYTGEKIVKCCGVATGWAGWAKSR